MRTDSAFLAIENAMASIDDTVLAGLDVAGLREVMGGLADAVADGWVANAREVMLRRRREAAAAEGVGDGE